MDDPVDQQLLELFSIKRGLTLEQARAALVGLPAELCDRIQAALQYQTGDFLYDPIEDQPSVRQLVDSVTNEVMADPDLAQYRWVPGYSFKFSCRIAEVLAERHSITWFPMAAMNPHMLFD